MRLRTQAAHDRLHGHAAFAALLDGSMSSAGYLRLLARLLGLHVPIETRLAPHTRHAWLAWGPRTGLHSGRLRHDLLALGVPPAAIPEMPLATALLPAFADPAAALGCSWVVEGSAMGAKVLLRSLRSNPAIPSMAHGYFSPDPDQATRWLACCEAVEACGADPAAFDAMAAAADATFLAFDRWLGGAG